MQCNAIQCNAIQHGTAQHSTVSIIAPYCFAQYLHVVETVATIVLKLVTECAVVLSREREEESPENSTKNCAPFCCQILLF